MPACTKIIFRNYDELQYFYYFRREGSFVFGAELVMETKLQNLQKAIRRVGFLKFTNVVLEFWGTYAYKTLPEMAWRGKAYSMETVKELIAEIRSFGMESVPRLNHLGQAAQSRVCKGRHVVLDSVRDISI